MKKAKKLLSILTILLCLGTISTIHVPQTSIVPVISAAAKSSKQVQLNKKKITLYRNKSTTLKIKNATQKVKWSASNKRVALKKTGKYSVKVTAKKKGTTTITAKVGKKKYKCKVTIKVSYGSISGNVSYYYNKYRGNVPDTGAKVILIPTNKDAINVNITDHDIISWRTTTALPRLNIKYNKYNLYFAEVDGNGNYAINHVETGKYKVLFVSSETTEGAWFDSDDRDEYYQDIAWFKPYLSKTTTSTFAKAISYNKFDMHDVIIYDNNNTVLGNDFGITYI